MVSDFLRLFLRLSIPLSHSAFSVTQFARHFPRLLLQRMMANAQKFA